MDRKGGVRILHLTLYQLHQKDLAEKDKREVEEVSDLVLVPDPDPHIEIEREEDPGIDCIVRVVVVIGVEEGLLEGDSDPALVPVRTCQVEEGTDDYRFAVISVVTTNDILVEDKNLLIFQSRRLSVKSVLRFLYEFQLLEFNIF